MLNNNGKKIIGKNFLFILCIVCLMFSSFGFEDSFALELNGTGCGIELESDSDNILGNSQIDEVLEVDSQNSGELRGVERSVSGRTFNDIQNVVNEANSGDTIKLTGQYYSTGTQVVINKQLTIVGSSSTVLDGKSLSRIFYLRDTAAGTVIKDIKFTRGQYNVGSAIYVGAKNVLIDNCVVENNHCNVSGGAISTRHDIDTSENLKIINCRFIGNYGHWNDFDETSSGGAVGAYARGTEIRNCYFESNWVKGKKTCYGGALQVGIDLPGSNAKVVDCVFINNSAISTEEVSHGGAGCVRDGTSYISCIFINNSADMGGALTLHASGTIENCTFIENNANLYGGAISTGYFYEHMELKVTGCDFEGNTAPLGGAIQAMGTNIDIIDCNFKDNVVSEYGGAVNVEADDVAIRDSIFNSNIANVNGGAVYIKGKNTLVHNSTFISNEAIPDVNKLNDGLGGAIYVISSQALVEDNVFRFNTARNGSALYYDMDGEKLTLNGNTFYQNQAWSYRLPVYARDIYYEDNETVKVVLYGGNNIADFDNLAVSNAIYNAADNNKIVINDEFPVNGATSSGQLYQDDREYNMDVLLTVRSDDGEIIFNQVIRTDYRGEISVDFENLKPGLYQVSAKHYEDTYYKEIANSTTFRVYPKVDNKITISTNSSSYNFDDVVVWTLNISNEGPNNSTGVIVTNMLPDGLILIEDTSDGKYNPENGTLDIGDLNAGETLVFTFITVVNKTGPIVDRANVTSNEYDVNMANNYDEKAIDVAPASDLAVVKSVSNLSLDYLDSVTWTLEVTNNGPDDAHNVSLCDMLPDSLIFISCDGDYDVKTGIWNIGTLLNGEKVRLTVNCFVNRTGLIQNNASIRGDEFDYDLSNNNDSERIFVNPACDLEISNTANGTEFNFGDLVRWTLTITNNGPDNATDVKIEDILPEGFIYLSSTLDLTGNGFLIESLDAGDSISIDIITRANVTGDCLSSANVTSREYDYNLSNNQDDEMVFVYPASDLVVEKSVDDSEPGYGSHVIWTITVSNNGPDDANDVVVEDLLPDSLIWFDDDSLGSYNPITGKWNVGRLDNGESCTLNIECIVNATGLIQNNVSVKSSNHDYNLTNNEDNETVDVEKSADVSIIKIVNETNPNYGDLVKWTIIISNNGPDKATNVYIDDALPEGLILINYTATKGFYDNSIWTMCCLEKDETQYLEIITKVNKTGKIINIAAIHADEHDSNQSNDVSNQSIDVPLSVDLEVTVQSDSDESFFGDNVTWIITVKNNGPDNGTDVIMYGIVPEGLVVIGHNLTKGEYNGGEWKIGSLNVGEVVYLNLTTVSNTLGEKTLFGDVSCMEYDWIESNNQDNYTINVKPVADLLVSKLVDNEMPNYGDMVKWTVIVFNNGPNDATNVMVYDELPEGLVFIESDGDYDGSIWEVGNLDVGQSRQLNIICMVQSTGKIVNRVNVVSDELDLDSNNNYDEQSIFIAPASDLSVIKIASKYNYSVGDVIDYVIEVVNNGPDNAFNIKVQDKLPKSLRLKSYKLNKGKFNRLTNEWTIDSLGYGESASLHIKVIAIGNGIVKNIVSITSDNYDPNLEDNVDYAVVKVDKKPQVPDNKLKNEKTKAMNSNKESVLEKHPTSNPLAVLIVSLILSLKFVSISISKRK